MIMCVARVGIPSQELVSLAQPRFWCRHRRDHDNDVEMASKKHGCWRQGEMWAMKIADLTHHLDIFCRHAMHYLFLLEIAHLYVSLPLR
jgi:hypothetical protein